MTKKKKSDIIFLTVYLLSGAVLLGVVYGNLKSGLSTGTAQSFIPPPEDTTSNEPESFEASGLKLHKALHWKTID